jgi:hypothetical protein
MRPLAKSFFLSGRSSGTIRPLAKPFSRFILHRAGRLEQLDHLKKKQQTKKSMKKTEKKRKRERVFTIILLYKTYYTKSKENKFSNAFAP